MASVPPPGPRDRGEIWLAVIVWAFVGLLGLATVARAAVWVWAVASGRVAVVVPA